jgi:DNA-binding transcriptional MerR regulator
MKNKLTHRDLAQDLGVSETTIKSYRRKFPEFIAVSARGKPLRFEDRALEVCRLIRACFTEGLSVGETRRRLQERFPEMARQRSASPESASQVSDLGQGLRREDLAELAAAFGDAAREAALGGETREVDAKLGRIQHSLEELVALQTRNTTRQAELLARLDTLLDSMDRLAQPRPQENARRVVVARAQRKDGPAEEAAGGEARSMEAPPDEYLDMPVVIRSGRGEFLGVTAPSGEPFSLREFERYLLDRAGTSGAHPESRWEREGEDRVLTLAGTESDPGQIHVLTFAKTRTPRGNLVALLHKLAIAEREVSDAFLQAFFKQIKDAVA